MADELYFETFRYNNCVEILEKLNTPKPRYSLNIEIRCSDSRKRAEHYSFTREDEKYMIEKLIEKKAATIEEIKNKITNHGK